MKKELECERQHIIEDQRQIERLRNRLEKREKRYRLENRLIVIKTELKSMNDKWRERERNERWDSAQNISSNFENRECVVNEFGGDRQGLITEVYRNPERLERAGERRTELTLRLINIQGLSEAKLREVEHVFFGDIKYEMVRHEIYA